MGKIVLDNKLIKKYGEIDYNVKFTVDANSTLTVTISINSLGIEKVEEIKNITHALADKISRKIKIIISFDY